MVFCMIVGELLVASIVNAQRNPPVDVVAVKLDDSFDTESSLKLDSSISMLRRVFNSEEFAIDVAHTKFLIANNKKTNAEIYLMIVTGMNNYLNASIDGQVALKVKLFNEFAGSGNFGITDMVTRETRTHRCYVLDNDVKCYASHLAHEYMHQIGFIDKKRFIFFGTKTRSVPYIIGNIVDKLLKNNSKCISIDKSCTKPVSNR